MDGSEESAQHGEAQLLAEIGRCLFGQNLRVTVRLPAPLAAGAVAGWERDDIDEVAGDESPAERSIRHQAGALALIGLSIKERGTSDSGDEVTVELDAWQIGTALDAADQRDMLADLGPPNRSTATNGV